jgi:hypothetical protein
MNTSEQTADVNGDDHGSVDKPKLAWGAKQIGDEIERTPRQVHHLLSRGLIKSARLVGGRWVANRTALRREFGAE